MGSRDIPSAMKRTLRQEAGFGCAKCGCPIIEYHHIVPWEERQEHHAQDIVVLCPTCHRELGKASNALSYKAKCNPFNLKKNYAKGQLFGKISDRTLDLGGLKIVNCDPALKYFGNTVLRIYDDVDSTPVIYFRGINSQFQTDLLINGNELSFQTAGIWDVQFRTNFLKFSRNSKDSVTIDMRSDVVKVRARFKVGNDSLEISSENFSTGGPRLSGAIIDGNQLAAGVEIGQVGYSLELPNYAMASPLPRIVRRGAGRVAMFLFPANRPDFLE